MADQDDAPAVGAILIRSSDPAALARFYASSLGLPEPRVEGGLLGIRARNTFLGFEPEPGGGPAAAPRTPPRTTVWFTVADAVQAHARLLAAGAAPRRAPDATCSPGETLAVVADPEGNLVGLIGPAPR